MRRSSQPPARRPKPTRGRPRLHRESWSKVTVVLFDRQLVALEKLVRKTRSGTARVLSRAEVIRALIDALIESGIDVSDCASEADLRSLVCRRLSAPVRE